MITPIIKPINIKEYTVKQSKYEIVGKLPIRNVTLGPSGSGKTNLIASLILDISRDCVNRIYVFSPSINVDGNWEPVKNT